MTNKVNTRGMMPAVPAHIAAQLNKPSTTPAASTASKEKTISSTAQRRLPPPPAPRQSTKAAPRPPQFPKKSVQVVASATKINSQVTIPTPPPRKPNVPTLPKSQKPVQTQVQTSATNIAPKVTMLTPPTKQPNIPTPPKSPKLVQTKPTETAQRVATPSVSASPVIKQNKENLRDLRIIGTKVVRTVSPEPTPHIELPKMEPKERFVPPAPVSANQEKVAEAQKERFKQVYRLDSSVQPKVNTVWDEFESRPELSVKRTKAVDIAKGVYKSRTFKAVVVSTAFTLAAVFGVPTLIASLVGLSALLALSPPGWIILGAAVVGFVLGYLFSGNNGTADTTEAEEIQIFDRNDPLNQSKLYVGSFPSRFGNEGEELANKKHVGAFLSVNKPSDRQLVGGRIPYTHGDWADLGITYGTINAKEGEVLALGELELGAQFINEHLSVGESVYVSGQTGRQAIAAYLLKYYPARSVDEAMEMAGESSSDVRKLLEEYSQKVKEQEIYGYYEETHELSNNGVIESPEAVAQQMDISGYNIN